MAEGVVPVLDRVKRLGWPVLIFFTVKGLLTLWFGKWIIGFFAGSPAADVTASN